jgi:hypothetical protein
MFNKRKKEIQPVKELNYTQWETELGFLNLLMTRKKNIVKNYFISIFKTQLVKDTDFIRDEDLEESISSSIFEVFNELSPAYKNHLVYKYFGSEDELLKFITEDFYVDLTAAAIAQNNEKVRLSVLKKKVENLNMQQFRRTDIEENE